MCGHNRCARSSAFDREHTHTHTHVQQRYNALWGKVSFSVTICHSVCGGLLTCCGSISAYINHIVAPSEITHTHTPIRSMCPLASDTNIWAHVGGIMVNWFLLFVCYLKTERSNWEQPCESKHFTFTAGKHRVQRNKHPERPWLIVEMLYSALTLPLIASHVHNSMCSTTKFSIFIRSCWGAYNVLSSVSKYQWNPHSSRLFLTQPISDFCHPTCADQWHRGSECAWLLIATHGQIKSICTGETQFWNQDWWV